MSLFSFESMEKINKLFPGIGSDRIVKNCELGLEMLPEAAETETNVALYGSSLVTFSNQSE